VASNSERAANSFMPLYGGDYLRDTMHLSCTEHGVYLRLLIHYWHTQRPLPNDMAKLSAIAGCRNEADTEALRTIYQQYFKSRRGHGNLLYNKRMDKEIRKALELKKKKRRGGLARAQQLLKSAQGVLSESSANTTATATARAIPQPEPQPPLLGSSPSASNLEGESQNPSPAVQQRTPRRWKRPDDGVTVETWDAYNGAYKARYGVDAVRNATTNGQLAQVVKRLGAEEAPRVAAFYVGHNRGLYVSARHPVNLLLRECEGLRTEWATNRMVTDTDGRQADRTQSNFNSFAPLIEEAREREKNGGK